MIANNFSQIPVFFADNQKTSPPKKRTKQHQTRLQRQKESRYEILCRRRFNPSKVWGDGHYFDEIGYHSDESEDRSLSPYNLDKTSPDDLLDAVDLCEPFGWSESNLNTAVSEVLFQLELNSDCFESDVINEMVNYFFSTEVLNKMSTFIGSKGISSSIQFKIMKMYEELLAIMSLSNQLIVNLINSSMIPKLIHLITFGSEGLVEKSLHLLMFSLEMNSSAILFTHILSLGIIDVMTVRAEALQWKTQKANSLDLKSNRRQLILEKSFSIVASLLFRHFARTAYRLFAFDMDDSLRVQLMAKMTPLLNRLMACPDFLVLPPAIDCLRVCAERKDPFICSVIVESFAQNLLVMSDINEEPIAFAILRVFNTLMAAYPQLFAVGDFGSILIYCLDRIIKKGRNNRLEAEMIQIIESISKWINMEVINMEAIRQLSYQMINLLSLIYKSGDRFNQIIAIQSIETILCKYSFESFVKLLIKFDIKDLIKELMLSNDRQQQIAFNIIALILNILSDSFNIIPEEVEKIKNQLFGKTSEIYYCLEKLSFKTHNQFMSNRANTLLQQIDGKLGIDEDISLVPNINESGFVFGFNF